MRTISRLLPLLVLPAVVLSLSCAAPAELARRSDKALADGNHQKAYEWAKRALDKDPNNPEGLRAMRAASATLANDHKRRVRALAEVDTLAAAERTLVFDRFRVEVARYGVTLPSDPGYQRDEVLIRSGAARHHYAAAKLALENGQPRQAYRGFQAARRYVPNYRDVEKRIQQAYDLSVERVAILPFVNETGVRGLSEELHTQVTREVAKRAGPPEIEFMVLVDPADIVHHVSVAQTRDLPRGEAIALGKSIGADVVMRGRVWGQRVNTNLSYYRDRIYRRVKEKDESGAVITRYVEEDLHAIVRERKITVNWAVEALDVTRGLSRAERSDVSDVAARTVFTIFKATGDCDDYCLLPPNVKDEDPKRWKATHDRWTASFGSWTLPAFLEAARVKSGRNAYRASYRSEFVDGSGRPVLLDDLPGEDEMVLIALNDVWKPVYGVLRELDNE